MFNDYRCTANRIEKLKAEVSIHSYLEEFTAI